MPAKWSVAILLLALELTLGLASLAIGRLWFRAPLRRPLDILAPSLRMLRFGITQGRLRFGISEEGLRFGTTEGERLPQLSRYHTGGYLFFY